MLESEKVWSQASRELLRALRGSRSQTAFSRRLGYRSNVAADWEGGHRSPTVHELLRAMERVGVDVDEGFHQFQPKSAPLLAEGVHVWLSALAGHTPQTHIAERARCSRHQARRWLSGEARPRVPDFLRLLHALTGRAPDWVAALLPIEQVPSLYVPWRSAQTAARLAYDEPWSSAVRIVIATDAYRSNPTDAWLMRALDLEQDQLASAVRALLEAGLVTRSGTRLVPEDAFTSDAKASDEDTRRLKAHWARVAADRAQAQRPGDLMSLNLISVSRADLDKVRDLQRAYYRELRSLVAASSPEETAALVTMQIVTLDD